MEYKINPTTGEMRLLAKTAKKPRYRPIYYDFFSSMRILSPAEVVVFFSIVQLMNRNIFMMNRATKTEISEMSNMHYKTVELKIKSLLDKGFLMKKLSRTGHPMVGVYFVNPYFATERADMAFTLRNVDYGYNLDERCEHIMQLLEEHDNAKFGAKLSIDSPDQAEHFE